MQKKKQTCLLDRFKLSARNLWCKLDRTFMVGIIEDSIYLIGVVSLIAVSVGVHYYIYNIQDDLLKRGVWANTNKNIENLLGHE